MEPMTPEERFTRIENAIQSLVETQGRHEAEIEKQNAGIRDLIIVSRTILESQKEIVNSQKQVIEQIGQLTRKLDTLTENIDKLIRGRGPNGQI